MNRYDKLKNLHGVLLILSIGNTAHDRLCGTYSSYGTRGLKAGCFCANILAKSGQDLGGMHVMTNNDNSNKRALPIKNKKKKKEQ